MDGMLSQEEINALLNGLGTDDGDVNDTEHLTDAEKDAIGEISNISMGTAATTLFS
jgi:flagellar motor switch protein FliN/FliY